MLSTSVQIVFLLKLFQILASASSCCGPVKSEIRLWDLTERVCKRTLSYHEHDIVALSYSRDDRFLISMGKYVYIYTLMTDTQRQTFFIKKADIPYCSMKINNNVYLVHRCTLI